MSPVVLGVSGSPVPNSNTDRAVKGVLQASGLDSEFVKLSEINVKPCQACKQCVPHNVCQVNDDFPSLAEKLKKSQALVIGAYPPYGMIDAYTKAFLERLWSMRHVNSLNRGKLGVIIVNGLFPYSNNQWRRKVLLRVLKPIYSRNLGVDQVANNIERELRMERMDHIGTVKIRGNVPCLTCGQGSTCKMSGVPVLFGSGTKASSKLCINVENQIDTWREITRLGKLLGARLS
ncbi:MAG: flavodoxin family protein [Candidatus Heimdallarchaeota archaeon]|nr:flavodoxin family protein [Candidatus Heimdallarchaeota archaeon]